MLFMSTRDTMAKKGKDKGPAGRPGERPKGPIGKAEMIQALCTEATYNNLDQWVLDIEAYAGDTEVTETIQAINAKVEEDIYYTKLFVMELLAANAKAIDPLLLDRMAAVFTDCFPQLLAASAFFKPSKHIEINALTNGLYLQLKAASKDPAAFINGLYGTIPKEVWEQTGGHRPPTNIPLLVAMKALDNDVAGSDWPFMQALENGYDKKILLNDADRRWDFKYAFNRVLDHCPNHNDGLVLVLPYLAGVERNIADLEVVDNVLFWLTERFNLSLNDSIRLEPAVKKDLFNTVLAIAKRLKPDAKVADRLPKKVWEGIAEAMKAPSLDPDLRTFFKGILDEDKGTVGQTAASLGKDIDIQLGTLRDSTGPNERFFAVDRLRSIVTVNLVPLAPEIRDRALTAILQEAERETDRVVRNGLLSIVLESGGQSYLDACRDALEKHLEDPAWTGHSESQVNVEAYGKPYFRDYPTRTLVVIGLVSRLKGMPPDEKLRAITKKLAASDITIRHTCYTYLIGSSKGEELNRVILDLINSGFQIRAILHNRLSPLYGPPLVGGVTFILEEDEVDGLVASLKSNYKDASEDAKAKMRRILIQAPSMDLKDILAEEYRRDEPDDLVRMTDYWLQLGFLAGLGPKARDICANDPEEFIRAYTQVRLESVLEDCQVANRMGIVDIWGVMKAMGLKIDGMKLVDVVLNERLEFEAVIPALDVLREGDLDILLNRTMELFNAKLDGIERRLMVILNQFCPHIRKTHTEWYEKRWLSPLQQMVLARDYEGNYNDFWSERDRDLALMWVKEDAASDYWPHYIGILWNISDENFRIKKVVPAVLKNWRDEGLMAMGDLDRLDDPLDVISTDKALGQLYVKVWDKYEGSRETLMTRWFSLEHFVETYKDYRKAKGAKKEQLGGILIAGLTNLAYALANRYYEGKLDLDKPLPGAGPLVKAIEDFFDRETADVAGVSTHALYCLLAGGWGPFLGKVGAYVGLVETAKGASPPDGLKFTYSEESTDNSLPAILLKAIEKGHIEALGLLVRLLDTGLVSGMEGWAGSDRKYDRLMELVARAGSDPMAVAKALEGHPSLQITYIMQLRGGLAKRTGTERPKPSDFGANPIVYDL
jgi:hypothetical protein